MISHRDTILPDTGSGMLYFQISPSPRIRNQRPFSPRSPPAPCIPPKTIRRSVNRVGCTFRASFRCLTGRRRRARETDTGVARREGERGLVNARENWLLNLAAGMSAAHPCAPFRVASSAHLLGRLLSRDPFFPSVHRNAADLEGMRNCCGR